MLETITPEIRNKLGKIGFEKDEIRAIEVIHELKIGKYPIDINEIVNRAVSANAREELLNRIDDLSWEMGERNFKSREDIYDRQNIF